MKNREILKKMFRCIYFICRKHWAQASFGDLVRFMADMGVEDFQYHIENAPQYATYLSDTSASEFINIIGNHIEKKVLGSLKDAELFTLMADESTDEQNREQMTVFFKWPKDDQAHFGGIINVERTDAESLLEAIQRFCIAKDIDLTKCRFVGFDGANVMSGEVSGLQRRVRHVSPLCLYMNCRNHRLALCLKHLLKECPLLADVDESLLAVWKLFHYSPQRFSIFKNIQDAYGEKRITFVRAAAKRWLSHSTACVRFIERFAACLDAVDEIYTLRREPEVFGLRIAITNKNTMMMLLLCDVLKPVNVLSEFLQKADVNFMDVDSKVKAATNELEGLIPMIQSRNDHDEIYFSKCDDVLTEIDDRTDLRRRMRGENFLDPDTFVREKAVPFIYSLIGEINDAFSCNPVFRAFRALDPRELPDDLGDLPDHGKADIDILSQHYGTAKEDKFKGHTTRCPPDITAAHQLQTEYTGFKHQRHTHRQGEAHGEVFGPKELQAKMVEDPVMKRVFPQIFKLVRCKGQKTGFVGTQFEIKVIISCGNA